MSKINHKSVNPAPLTTLSTITYSKCPAAAIRDTKKFAKKMGYRWQENTDNLASSRLRD